VLRADFMLHADVALVLYNARMFLCALVLCCSPRIKRWFLKVKMKQIKKVYALTAAHEVVLSDQFA
jgi:hypothetical protein